MAKSSIALCVIARVPPPVNGMTVINQKVISAIPNELRMYNYLIASKSSINSRFTVISRNVAEFFSPFVLLRARLSAGSCKVYSVAFAGWSIVLNCWNAAWARLFGFHQIVHHHSFSYINEFSPWMALLVRLTGSNSTHVVLCECMAERFLQRYPRATKPFVVTNYFSMQGFGPSEIYRRQGSSPEFVLGYLSNITSEKGFFEVVDTFQRLKHNGQRVKLVIAGPFIDPKCRQHFDNLLEAFPENVEYRGAIFGEDKQDFFRDIDCFLFPTRYKVEAQPLVLIEAHAYGRPCITTNRGCIAEQLNAQPDLVVADSQCFSEVASDVITNWIAFPEAFELARTCCFNQVQIKIKQSHEQLSQLTSFFASSTESIRPQLHDIESTKHSPCV